MPRFAANLSFLFRELPFLSRFEAAARIGFEAVEFHYPYSVDAEEIASQLEEHRLQLVLFNVRQGDTLQNEWGYAGLPGREDQFRQTITEAIEYAHRLKVSVPQLHCLAGILPDERDRTEYESMFVQNIRWAADEFRRCGMKVNIEPINNRDVPGYLVHNTRDAIRLMDLINRPNVMLQYDAYHMQIMEGDLHNTIESLLPRIGHIQFADVPGRHEPGTGEINFEHLFQHLDKIGYAGWVSAEYRPLGDTERSLEWFSA